MCVCDCDLCAAELRVGRVDLAAEELVQRRRAGKDYRRVLDLLQKGNSFELLCIFLTQRCQ